MKRFLIAFSMALLSVEFCGMSSCQTELAQDDSALPKKVPYAWADQKWDTDPAHYQKAQAELDAEKGGNINV